MLCSEGTGKVQKEPSGEAVGFVSEKSSFFSFQTAISIEWEVKEMVHEEMEIGMCEELSSEGKVEHLLERTTESRYCPR